MITSKIISAEGPSPTCRYEFQHSQFDFLILMPPLPSYDLDLRHVKPS